MNITLTEDNGTEHDITESVAFMYDAIIQSLDWGSGFLDLEETLHIASVGVLAGYQVPEGIPLEDYPKPRTLDPAYRTVGGGFLRDKYNADVKAWEADYGKRAREAIFARLAVFDMTDEYNPPTEGENMDQMKVRVDGSAAYVSEEPDEQGRHHGEWKHTGQPVTVIRNDETDEWEEAR